MKSLWYLQLLILAVVSLWYLPLSYSAIKILKRKYESLWKQHGSFELFGNNNVISSYKLLKFIISAKYKSTGDEKLISKFDTCRVLLVVATAVAIIQFLITILMVGGYVPSDHW